MTATPDDVRRALNNYIKAWATNDRALLMSILSEKAVFCDPVGTPEFIGHEGIGKFWDFSHMGEGRTLTPVLQGNSRLRQRGHPAFHHAGPHPQRESGARPVDHRIC